MFRFKRYSSDTQPELRLMLKPIEIYNTSTNDVGRQIPYSIVMTLLAVTACQLYSALRVIPCSIVIILRAVTAYQLYSALQVITLRADS